MYKYGTTLPIVMAIAVGVMALIGGGSYYANSKIEEAKQAELEKTSLPGELDNIKSVDEIRVLAAGSLDGATILSVGLEREDAGLVYKVKLSDGRVLFFNATTGDAITDPTEDNEDVNENDDIPSDFTAKITLDEARRIASERRPGKAIKKIEIETEDGHVVYKVKFTDSGVVEINATTGAIIKVEKGDTVDDKKDQNDEGDYDSNADGEDQGDGNEDVQQQETLEFKVGIEGNAFSGIKSLTKDRPTKIEIENKDSVAHTFTITGLGVNVTIPAGDSKTVNFTPATAGTFTVSCTLHGFTSSITVN